MWTMAHPSEEAAFEGYVATFPSASILLIDTYDTLRGAARAAAIAREKLRGVRLDSGDLLSLSRGVRRILDDHGCRQAKIVASGDLNEHRIAELRAEGAPIDVYGVGTDLVTSIDAPALGGVYKLTALERDGVASPIAKFSEGKATLPGAHQVHRFHDEAGFVARDVIALVDDRAEELGAGPAEALLVPVMAGGARTAPAEPLAAVRARAQRSLAALPPQLLAIEEPAPSWTGFVAERSPRLRALIEVVRAQVGAHT
jgi:nicotinate phosphoribosyltransferase